MAKITIDEKICKGCGLCVEACPKKVIALSKHKLNAKGYFVAEPVELEKCIGCTLCAKNCPVNAISGTLKNPHTIDKDKCIKCGVCMDKCKFKAISKK